MRPRDKFNLIIGFSLVLICKSSLASGRDASFSLEATPTVPDISTLSTEQKIGQLLYIGFSGQALDKRTSQHLLEMQAGGVILFKRNLDQPPQIQRLTTSLASIHRIPPFIGVDQEGGGVSRVRFTPPQPSARAIGETRNAQVAYDLGLFVGRALASLGINMNFAPDLDLGSKNFREGFLKTRAYSYQPHIVDKVGSSYARGLSAAGVLPTAKHFPGIGGIQGDPHLQGIVLNISKKDLFTKSPMPFQEFLRFEYSAVMLAHAHYPALGADGFSPYSRTIASTLLRDTLSYKGIIITDDLLMAGAGDKHKTFSARLISAFHAGSDMMMLSWSRRSQSLAKATLLRAVLTGKISRHELDARVSRILAVKRWLFENGPARGPASEINLDLGPFMNKLRLMSRTRGH